MKMFVLALSLFLVSVVSALPAETVTAPLTRLDLGAATLSLLKTCTSDTRTCGSCCARALTKLSDRLDLVPQCLRNCVMALKEKIRQVILQRLDRILAN